VAPLLAEEVNQDERRRDGGDQKDYHPGSLAVRLLLAVRGFSTVAAWHGEAAFGYTPSMSKSTNGRILERILGPVSSSLNDEAAHKLIGIKADRKVRARVAALAEKCNQGQLTPAERRDYEMYLMAGHFVAVLQAQARILLARRGRPA
jgi:hypothetical protein